MPKPVQRPKPRQVGRKQPEQWNLPTRLHAFHKSLGPKTLLTDFYLFAPLCCFSCGRERTAPQLRVTRSLDLVCLDTKTCAREKGQADA